METETQQSVAAISRFEAIKQKADRLLALNQITVNDIDALDQMEREYIAETCTRKLEDLTGTERDKFLDKIALIMAPVTKADMWELNHAAISNAISWYMQQYGSTPTKNTIAEKTGLSRQTVAKHIAAHKTHPGFAAQTEQLQFMVPNVLANVYRHALKGDMKAARLYLEAVGATKPRANNTIANTQNNYIQINNTILSQDNLKHLSAEQLDQMERIVNGGRG